MRMPIFAIVGRPNVGKSTLFNRLAGRPIAIVQDTPGVTRDRIYARVRLDGDGEDALATIIDTGGLEPDPSNEIFAAVREQTEVAIEEADVIIHVVDARAGVTPDDQEVARQLRKSGRPLVVAANKMDSEKQRGLEAELYELGVDAVIPVSSAHGRGIGDLLDAAWEKLSPQLREGAIAAAKEDEEPPELTSEEIEAALDAAERDEDAPGVTIHSMPDVLRIALVGRPNAGKSSFVNRLLGEERHVVSEVAGTTVDAIDSFMEHGGRRFRLIDTAGIRRKRSIDQKVEKMSVVSALKGMDRADVVILLLDAAAGLAEQDKKIAAFADEKGKAVVIVVNKWDLAPEKELEAEKLAVHIREQLQFLSHAPIRFASAKTGKRVFDVLDTVTNLAEKHFMRVPTADVNRALKAATDAHQPPVHKGRRTKLLFGTQVRSAPATFVIASNDPEGVHFSYRRFLINRFREDFGFGGAPIRIFFRARSRKAAAAKGRK